MIRIPDKTSTGFAIDNRNKDIISGITAPPMLIAIVLYILRDEFDKPDLKTSLALSEIIGTCDLTFIIGMFK